MWPCYRCPLGLLPGLVAQCDQSPRPHRPRGFFCFALESAPGRAAGTRAGIASHLTPSRPGILARHNWTLSLFLKCFDAVGDRNPSLKTEQRPSRASASIISPSSSKSIKRIPIYFRDRRSEPAAALTGLLTPIGTVDTMRAMAERHLRRNDRPGLRTFRRIRRSFSSGVQIRTNERIATARGVDTEAGVPLAAVAEPVRMMEAPSFRNGSAFWTLKSIPLTFESCGASTGCSRLGRVC
jgi:hypothetical protein